MCEQHAWCSPSECRHVACRQERSQRRIQLQFATAGSTQRERRKECFADTAGKDFQAIATVSLVKRLAIPTRTPERAWDAGSSFWNRAANKWRGEQMARQRARQGEGQDTKFNRARSSIRRTSGAIADAATCRDPRSPLSRAPTPRVRRARPSHRGVGSVPAETRRLRNTPSGRPPRRGGGRRAGRRVPAGPRGVSDRALHSPNTRPTPILFPVPRVHFSRVSPFCNDPRQRISGAVEHAQAALRDHGLCRRLHGAYR